MAPLGPKGIPVKWGRPDPRETAGNLENADRPANRGLRENRDLPVKQDHKGRRGKEDVPDHRENRESPDQPVRPEKRGKQELPAPYLPFRLDPSSPDSMPPSPYLQPIRVFHLILSFRSETPVRPARRGLREFPA